MISLTYHIISYHIISHHISCYVLSSHVSGSMKHLQDYTSSHKRQIPWNQSHCFPHFLGIVSKLQLWHWYVISLQRKPDHYQINKSRSTKFITKTFSISSGYHNLSLICQRGNTKFHVEWLVSSFSIGDCLCWDIHF